MKAKSIAITICVLIASLISFGCGIGQIFGPAATPVPSETPLPTNTPLPTATPAPAIVGSLVEAPIITPEGKTQIARPLLGNEIVFLCLMSGDKCTVSKNYSTKTDASGAFVFNALPEGTYVVLYAAFLNQQTSATATDEFWAFWEGRTLDFSSLAAFTSSFIDSTNVYIVPQYISDHGYGSLSEIYGQSGGMANTGVCYMLKYMALEFVGDMQPQTVTVIPGQTVQVTVESHAGLVITLF